MKVKILIYTLSSWYLLSHDVASLTFHLVTASLILS